ncbi:hypothetical protein OIU77_031229 [Salix suchowensis]|uniref:Uncharacterized protein n=1 Tax=Salix suchowensis TaxID=1278906 RepID=A0ABQ9BF05_9ROSI|nr:hypothetical protein OIU77_031229 [Salix suchowensis]
MEKEKESLRSNNNGSTSNTTTHSSAQRTTLDPHGQTTSSDFVLQWGNRKRLSNDNTDTSDHQPRSTNNINSNSNSNNNNPTTHSNGYFNLRQRPAPPPPPPPQRILRNSENSSVMRGGQSKVGGLRRVASPGKGAHDERSNNNHLHHHHNSINHENHNHNNKSAASSDSKKGGRSSSGGSGEPPPPPPPPPPFWPPKFDIALTNKEKEEDFFAFKGSKLPQRPKKRAKFIQRSLNLVSPGAWLCDLTLERYEVREKKITKKRPRGLKAMGTMDSDSD